MIRHVITALLLAFVATTVGKLIYDAVLAPEPVEAAVEETDAALLVYYFHTDVRCWNCNTIERFTHETLAEHFADELAAGSIEWRVANIDEAINDHFVDDYELVSSSVVLVEMAKSDGATWKELKRAWDLVHAEEFKAYIEEAVRAILEEES